MIFRALIFLAAILFALPVCADEEFSDAFTRADNTDIGAAYDAGYTGFDNFQIVSNAIRSTTVDPTGAMETLNSPSIGNDQYVQATVSAWTTPGSGLLAAFMVLRASAPATLTYYFGGPVFFSGTTRWEIWKTVAGSDTQLASPTGTMAANDVVLFTVVGTELKLYKNGTLMASATDSDIASGRPGFRVGLEAGVSALADVQLDNFSAGDFDGCNLAMNVASSAFLLNDATSKIRRNTATGCPGGGAVVNQNLPLMGVGS